MVKQDCLVDILGRTSSGRVYSGTGPACTFQITAPYDRPAEAAARLQGNQPSLQLHLHREHGRVRSLHEVQTDVKDVLSRFSCTAVHQLCSMGPTSGRRAVINPAAAAAVCAAEERYVASLSASTCLQHTSSWQTDI
jgi:hypothetical protein